MPKLNIDNREVEVEQGATILDAARRLGIDIPTMCFRKGCEPSTSCMVCVVRVNGSPNLVPACATLARDGMQVENETQEILQARKTALELLLSDHLGDCIAPCQVACPAGMNIPLMTRQIASGRIGDAIITIKRDIALPAVLGRICPAPCERACRRADIDEAVSIRLLKRYAAEADLISSSPYSPACMPDTGKNVAVVGAGPAGLAGAYYLRQHGHRCTIFDDHDKAGGMLQYAVSEKELPRDILEREIALIRGLGVEFSGGMRIGSASKIAELRRDFDAIFVAIGRIDPADVEALGLAAGPNGIAVDRDSSETSLPGVFAGGDCVRRRRLTVRAVADGKKAAVSIHQLLSGQPPAGPGRRFSTHTGRIQQAEMQSFLAGAAGGGRIDPTGEDGGFTTDQARAEAARCLHCDCRKPDKCKLRQYAQQYGASATRYKHERRLFVRELRHPDIVYEPGKCIKCGLCIQIAARAGEKLGLAFVGRGFDVRVAVPFDKPLAEALQHAADKCVEACPTGALAFRDEM